MIPGSVMKETTIHTVIPLPNNTDQIFVCLKSSQAYLMTPQGQVVRTYSSGTYSTSVDQILYHLISFDSSILRVSHFFSSALHLHITCDCTT